MKHGLLGAGIALLASAGLGLAQSPSPLPALGTDASSKTAAISTVKPLTVHVSDTKPANVATTPNKLLPVADDKKPTTGTPSTTTTSAISDVNAGPVSKYWASGEYLLWWMKKSPGQLPIISGGPQVTSGPLGQPDTQLFFGGNGQDYGPFSGTRLTIGTWLDDSNTLGFEARGFYLFERHLSARFSSDTNGNPALGFPFFDVIGGAPDFFDFATPGETSGRVAVSTSSRLWGAEGNLLANVRRTNDFSLDVIGGFRYLDLKENVTISGASAILPGFQLAFGGQFFDPPAVTTAYESFQAHNHFYAGQIGARAEIRRGNFTVGASAKLALGYMHSSVDINGISGLHVGGAAPAATLPGALFAQSSNIGRFTHDDFAIAPEGEIRVGYKITQNLTAFVGYNFLYMTKVARASAQISPVVSTTQVPSSVDFVGSLPGSQPQPIIRTSDFWTQGMSFGLELKF